MRPKAVVCELVALNEDIIAGPADPQLAVVMHVIADDPAAVMNRDARGINQADFIVLNGPTSIPRDGTVLDLRVILLNDKVLYGYIRGAAVESIGQFTSFNRVTRWAVSDVNLVGGIVEIEGARNNLGESIDRLERGIVEEYSLG